MNRGFITAVLAAFTLLITSAGVSALTVANVTEEQLTNKAEMIVIGTVLSAYSERDAFTREVYTFISIRVSDHMKGTNRARVIELKTLGGATKDQMMYVPGAPDFHKNEEVMLFLERRADGSLMPVGMALGKYSVYRDAETDQKIVLRQTDGYGRYFSTPRAEKMDLELSNKVFLNEFRSRIQKIVNKGGQQ